MICKACKTTIGDDERFCPNCGRSAKSAGVSSGQTQEKVDLSTSRSSALPEVDLELEEEAEPKEELEVEETPEEEPEAKAEAKAPRTTAKKKGRAAAPPEPAPEADHSLFSLDPTELRTVLAGQPELLESGLEVYADEDGTAVGAGFLTEVGNIDLLAQDERGDLVVVMVAERDGHRELVAEVLQRIGWIRKHLAKRKQEVRGIVLLEPHAEDLSYAASAVAGTVDFKTYRVALSFDDLGD